MLFLPAAMMASVYFTALEQAGRSLVVAVSRGLVLPVLGLAVFPALWGAPGIWMTPVFAEGLTVLVAAGCLVAQAGALARRGDPDVDPAAGPERSGAVAAPTELAGL